MIEYRRTTIADFAFGADVGGFWSLSGARPWMPLDATPTGYSQHEMAEEILDMHRSVGTGRTSALAARAALHSTSWLPLANRVWDAFIYVAAVDLVDGLAVDEQWPMAVPIGSREFDAAGPQPPHSAIDPPDGIRWAHVARHGLRHYRMLTDPNCYGYNPTVAAAVAAMNGPEVGRSWFGIHLERLKGALAGEFTREMAREMDGEMANA